MVVVGGGGEGVEVVVDVGGGLGVKLLCNMVMVLMGYEGKFWLRGILSFVGWEWGGCGV